ncbi:MAG: phosphate butyryltransferase [Syntrophaceae bacterium]|nr:phosphate butyryltransferase [Syntrophaceae bacterium]
MMTSFEQIRREAKARGKKRLVVAPVTAATDLSTLSAAMADGLVFPVLVGDGKAAASWLGREKIPAARIEIIEEPDDTKALTLAIDMVKKDAAEILMRGGMGPKRFFEAILDRDKGLLKERVASVVSVFDPPGVDRVTMATDTYVNSFPSIAEKITITENVIKLAGVLGLASPKIAALSAIEQVNPAIPSTMDAAILSKMAERGQFGDVTLEGPLDIDCAVSRRAATRKGVHSPVTGQGDIYLMPNVEAGFLMAELSVFIGKTPMACALMGVSRPVVLNLPFVPAENRATEIDLAVLLCGRL